MTTPAFPALRVTILRHPRCKHCRLLHQVGKDYVCDAGIGGTAVVWATGRRAFRRRRPAGWPDITGILPGGRFIGLECKAKGGRQPPAQKAMQQEIEKRDGIYVLARGVEDVERRLTNDDNGIM